MQVVFSQILNKILQTGDYSIVKTNGLEAQHFGDFSAEFKLIEEHYQKYGNVPDMASFLEKFPNFELIEVNETDSYLLDRLYEEYGFIQFAPFVVELAKKAKSDTRDAYNYMLQHMQTLRPKADCKGENIIANARERYDEFMAKSNQEEKHSIKTGLIELDDIFGGWDFGDELVTIVARTNQGKSWLAMKFLTEAWKQGYPVSLYSGEMNHIKLGYRFDALFNHFSNRGLVWGNQGQVDGYAEYIDKLSVNPTPFIIATQKHFHGKPTVAKIRNFIEETNPKILGIDQYSLVEDGRGSSRDPQRLKLAHISEDLFLLSTEYKIPIIGLAQANRAGINKDNDQDAPDLENIKESDDIAHNSSRCIGMRQSNFGLILDIIKNREGRVGDKLRYSWDIDTGHFSYIPSADDAAKPEIRQVVQQQTSQILQNANSNFAPF